jgi:hypothetical protein
MAKEKKYNIISIVIVIVLVILVVVLFNVFEPKVDYVYSDDPTTWIEDKAGGIKEINVDKVTKGEGYVDFNGVQINTEEIGTVFGLDGWYNGIYFNEFYVDIEGNIKMKISHDMKPDDGVIEGFIIERLANSIPTIFIFLDEDWKNKIDNTYIYWGRNYQNEKQFDFVEISSGIYMDYVEDDINRFENNYNLHYGGVYVGALRDDNSSTLISFS